MLNVNNITVFDLHKVREYNNIFKIRFEIAKIGKTQVTCDMQ